MCCPHHAITHSFIHPTFAHRCCYEGPRAPGRDRRLGHGIWDRCPVCWIRNGPEGGIPGPRGKVVRVGKCPNTFLISTLVSKSENMKDSAQSSLLFAKFAPPLEPREGGRLASAAPPVLAQVSHPWGLAMTPPQGCVPPLSPSGRPLPQPEPWPRAGRAHTGPEPCGLPLMASPGPAP